MRRVDTRLSSGSDAYKRTSGLSEMVDNPEVASLRLEGLRGLDSFFFFTSVLCRPCSAALHSQSVALYIWTYLAGEWG